MKKLYLSIPLIIFVTSSFGKALVDANVATSVKTIAKTSDPLSLIVFLHSFAGKKTLINDMNQYPDIKIQDLAFMPAVAVKIPATKALLNKLANHPEAAQISSYQKGSHELDISSQALKLAPSSYYPDVKNWWAEGYTGHTGVVGLIDEGIDPEHPVLADKQLIVRKEKDSHYDNYKNGVRTPHGTGVACIYASPDPQFKGIAYGAKTFVTGLSGAETADSQSISLTLSTLDWMLNRAETRPTLINYSIGNGFVSCPDCPEWSGLAKVIDFVVNTEKILWVKSAGNMGYIEPTPQKPFASKLTVPADNYNALTIANINTVIDENGIRYKTPNRDKHVIHPTSSRGPTSLGRRKPDLSAPGFNTRTCAPDPQSYGFQYAPSMEYHDGFRLMGGTSAAAPHVGASALLLQDAGIQSPMAIKALLINSADAWTDSNKSQPVNGSTMNHFSVMGSEWNRTYGWGYLNMQKAFDQRKDLIESKLTLKNPLQEYKVTLGIGEKITLVHERRVGYFNDSTEWKLSHLALELIDLDTQQLIASDDSPIDTVHQVANCIRLPGQRNCSDKTKTLRALVRVKLLNSTIDGSSTEPFALVLPGEKQLAQRRIGD